VEPRGLAGIGVLARIWTQALVEDRRVALPHRDEAGHGCELDPQRPPRESTRSHHGIHNPAEHLLAIGTEHRVEVLAERLGRRSARPPA
jgi:hypothetical protein